MNFRLGQEPVAWDLYNFLHLGLRATCWEGRTFGSGLLVGILQTPSRMGSKPALLFTGQKILGGGAENEKKQRFFYTDLL